MRACNCTAHTYIQLEIFTKARGVLTIFVARMVSCAKPHTRVKISIDELGLLPQRDESRVVERPER
jgi:hypothetical protein